MESRKQTRREFVTLAALAPRQDIAGRSGRRVFGAAAASQMTRDLAPKKSAFIKGGRKPDRLSANDNFTLVRTITREDTMAVSKKKKDLAPKKNPKGGAKPR